MKKLVTALTLALAATTIPFVAECGAQDAPPSAVKIAQTTTIPACTGFVDANAASIGDGTMSKPYKKISEAVKEAAPGAIICVAEGTYAEEIVPADKPLTLAGGFQSGSSFSVRDSAKFVSRAQGDGDGSFVRILDPAPAGELLTAIDGFEITGYGQAIVRQYWEAQRFEITNNYIHDNKCAGPSLVGAAFALDNISGTISRNVIVNNECGRGGGGFINDGLSSNSVTIESNWVDGNSGVEADSHGGGLYLFANKLLIRGNSFTNNKVTSWGGGLYVGANTPGGQFTNAELSGNVYRGNQAGDSGGGFFCDDGAKCSAAHEIYVSNCGGNVLVDGGAGGSGPTISSFTNITNVGALTPDCSAPGIGFWMDTYEPSAKDTHTISDSIFWGNAKDADLAANCGTRCELLSLRIDNSIVQSKALEDGVKVTFGQNIFAPADPFFVEPDKGDFRLGAGSPAIGKGKGGGDLGALGNSPPPSEKVQSKAAVASAVVTANSDGGEAKVAEPATPATGQSDAVEAAAASQSRTADDLAAKDAFESARELGTAEAWAAFLEYYPNGFYAALARGYLVKLGQSPAAEAPKAAAAEPAAAGTREAALPRAPAVARGGDYMGFPEKFNRYYTDPAWAPETIVYVSQTGGGDGSTRSSPMRASDAVAAARSGSMIVFTLGAYEGGFEFNEDRSGTYDQPIVVLGERNKDGSVGVTVDCKYGKRLTCFNLEAVDYVAIDGLELIDGRFGVRSVGAGFPASQHAKGIAVLNSIGHDQERDPFFTGQTDWAVFEGNNAYGAKEGDGHGFYLSNGGDWNIVRFNETHGNASSDFQINADPASVCQEVGIAFDDPLCDAYAGDGEGGQGASDYMLVDSNYFHHGAAQGANFTSVRRSVIRNNIFGPQARHNVSIWQETDNPKLGSSDNLILHNLFITNGRAAVQFIQNSTRNIFHNNLLIGVSFESGAVAANPSALLMEVDGSVAENDYAGNVYVTGTIEGRQPNDREKVLNELEENWFTGSPLRLEHNSGDLLPNPTAPFLAAGVFHPGAPLDRRGVARSGNVDAGPFELP